MARKLLKDIGAKKEMKKSWIEAEGKVQISVVGESNHTRVCLIKLRI